MTKKLNCNHINELLFQYVKDNYWYVFRGNSAIVSSTCRQLALGIGGVLLIQNSILCFGKLIFTLLVLFFLFDALQYLNQACVYYNLAKKYDSEIKAGSIDDVSKLVPPEESNNGCISVMHQFTNILFMFKLGVLFLASVLFLIKIWIT